MDSASMPPRHQAALELLCIAIHRDGEIRTWFKGLLACPQNLRTSALLQMTSTMRHNQEDDDLIDAISALCDPHLLDAVVEAVKGLD